MKRQPRLVSVPVIIAIGVLASWLADKVPAALAQNAPETAAAHHATGIAHLQAGRIEEALAEFRRALRLDRNYLPSLVRLADVLSSHERVFEAYGVLQHAMKVAPDSAEVRLLLGRCLFQLKKANDARQQMHRALELDPKLTEPHYALAAVEAEQGRFAEARQHIQVFLQAERESEAARELHARICLEMKDYDAALAAWQGLRQSHPARVEFQAEIARTLMAARRYAEAEQAWRSLLEQSPTNREALRGLFDASYQRGAYQHAAEAMQKLAALEPSSCEPLLHLARTHRSLDRFAEARKQAERCLALDAANPSARFLLGWLSFKEGELLQADAELAQALNSEPNDPEALYWLATVELRLGKRGSALARLEKAASLDPAHSGVRYTLALEFTRLNRPADAKKQMDDFRRLKSREEWRSESARARFDASGPDKLTNLADWLGFAEYLIQEKKPRDALALLETVRAASPDNPEALLLTAVALAETGEVERALAAYADAEKRGAPDSLFLGRGALYFRLGEEELALADLRRASQATLPPSKAAETHLILASLLHKKKRWSEAEGELRRAVDLDPNNAAARTLLAWTLLQVGRPADSAAECHRLLRQNPADASAQLILAGALLAQRRAADAAAPIQRAAAIEGETARVLLARGRLAAGQGQPATAADHFRRAGRADPSQPEVFYLLGTELLKLERRSDAAVAFEKATIIAPEDAGSWLELGKIYLSANRSDAAAGYFRKAATVAPENAECHYQLALALSRGAHTDEAIEEARRAHALGHPAARALLDSLAKK